MTAIVISFHEARDKRNGDRPPAHVFGASFGQDSSGGWIVELDFADAETLTLAENLRLAANAMEEMSRVIRDRAEVVEPSDDGLTIATVRVMENSRVRVWTSDKCEGESQVDWLQCRLEDAKECVAMMAEALT